VRGQFRALSANELLLTDFTEHPTRDGKVDFCTVNDIFSNRNVGYSISFAIMANLAISRQVDASSI
jgi:hypothetical protein